LFICLDLVTFLLASQLSNLERLLFTDSKNKLYNQTDEIKKQQIKRYVIN